MDDSVLKVAGPPIPELDTTVVTDTSTTIPEYDDPATSESWPTAELVPVLKPTVMDTAPLVPLSAEQTLMIKSCLHQLLLIHVQMS